jgi:prepilin signal peptidase PulO-like enzyme (type II secretory pathway)
MMASYASSVSVIPGWFWAIFGGLFGAAIASFLGVVGERIPRGESLGGHSHCVCGKTLGAANIPIFGWVFSLGRAGCCGAKIPVRYVIGEVYLTVAWATIAGLSPNILVGGVLMLVSAGVLLLFSWRRPKGVGENLGVGDS